MLIVFLLLMQYYDLSESFYCNKFQQISVSRAIPARIIRSALPCVQKAFAEDAIVILAFTIFFDDLR